jgi:AcrR family transcriptional regulator
VSTRVRSTAGRETAELLMVTAERLYGEYGIDAVSLRQIADAAGQRNPAVVQYHFGSRDGLLRAIVEFRAQPANKPRDEMLDELEQSGRVDDLPALLAAAVVPLLEVQPPDSHYLRFVARLHTSATLAPIYGEVAGAFDSVQRISRYVTRALADLPAPLAATRVALAFDMLLRSIADYQQQVEDGRPRLLPFDLFLDDLLSAVAGFLRAPTPPDAKLRLRRA